MFEALLLTALLAREPEVLDAVVVTAAGPKGLAQVPSAVTVVDVDAASAATPRRDFAGILARVPGVTVNDRRNDAQDLQLVVRGYGARSTFGVRGVRLYVNGIPATAPDGQGQLAHAVVDAADQVEVLRGPLAALYGNASGGVVRIETDPRDEQRFEALVAGGGGLRRASASARGHGIAATAAFTDDDGARPHARSRRRQFDAIGAAALGPWDLRWMANVFRQPLAEDPLGLTPAAFAADRDATDPAAIRFDTRKRVDQDQAGLSLSRDFASGGVRFAAYAIAREVEQFLAIPVATQAAPTHAGGVIDLARDSVGLEARTWRDRGPLTFTAGVNLDRLRERRRGYENFLGDRLGVRGALRRDERNEVDGEDVLLQVDWRPSEAWHAVAGWRHARTRFRSDDRYLAPGNADDSGGVRYRANVPVAAMSWMPATSWRVHAAWARGFETPTTNELAYRFDGGAGPNLTLRPMRSTQREVGLRWSGAGAAIEAAVFDDRTRDELAVARNAGGRAAFRNAGRTRRRGLELGAVIEQEHWDATFAATLIDARYVDGFSTCTGVPCTAPNAQVAVDTPLPAVPRRQLFAEVAWRPRTEWRAGIALRARSALRADDLGNAIAPGGAQLALFAQARFAREWRAFARLDNTLDRDFVGSVIVNEQNGRSFEPAEGRTLVLGLSWQSSESD